MSFLKQMLLTAVLCLALQYFFPWWTLVIGAFAAAYFSDNKGFLSFLAGFVGVALLWYATAMLIDMQTQSILTEKVAQLFPTKTPALLMLLTAVIGGLPGGFAALTAAVIKGGDRR